MYRHGQNRGPVFEIIADSIYPFEEGKQIGIGYEHYRTHMDGVCLPEDIISHVNF